jgi:Bacterial archaeo-eukaryotic release factor family 5
VRTPTRDHLRSLIGWQPPGGVISVYLEIHPEDRGEPWRIALRNGLAAARDEARDEARAFDATAERIERRLARDGENPSGRTRIGFAEVGAKPGREEWFAVQAQLPYGEIGFAARPALGPLAAILDGNPTRGVAVISAERVRLMLWSLAGVEELHDWELEIFSLDWRERKAQRPSDPAHVQGAKASGHDQYEQRLEANRTRFLRETGRLAASELSARHCSELLAFGEPDHVRALAEGAGAEVTVRELEPHNLISEPTEAIAKRAGEHVAALRSERERELVQRIEAEVGKGERGAVGMEAIRPALAQGRVEHLLFDGRADGLEQLVERALETSAGVTHVRSDAASALADAGGIAALLRY